MRTRQDAGEGVEDPREDTPRWRRMLDVCGELGRVVGAVDALYIGDYGGRLAPIKRQLAEALDALRAEAQAAYQGEQLDGSGDTAAALRQDS